MGKGPFHSHPAPHVRDPVSVFQPTPLPPTHIARGVDVRAGRQQSLHQLPMPMERRQVKWGELVLSGDRSGKYDTHTETQKRGG
jgi:hypothetical protein